MKKSIWNTILKVVIAVALQHLREAVRRVVELERLDDGASVLVDRAGDMASLGDVYPDADHGVLRSLALW